MAYVLGLRDFSIPETTLAPIDLRNHHREDVPPIYRMCRIVTGCRCVRSWMDVIARIVRRRMSIPAVIELTVNVVLVVVN
nr:hypothetical protein [Halanaeroarchaeum sulfurireducens]